MLPDSACRRSFSEDRRHRQPADGDPSRAGEGRQGPLRHALSATPEDSTHVLAAHAAEAMAVYISVARRGYIDAVRAYNLSLRTFPTLLWAKTFFLGNKPMAEFTASEGSEKPPQVKF
jgi:LemA family